VIEAARKRGRNRPREGRDPRSVARYLGHRNLQLTARYTALAPDQFKDSETS
jgi:site-specific recombinase XerD